MIRVQAWNKFVSPKFYGPLAIWPWLKINPQSSLNVIYCLIITAWQWLMSFPYTPCIPVQIKPIKACQGKGQGALPLREWLFSPFSSTGLSSLCEFVSSQPQRCRHCKPASASISHLLEWLLSKRQEISFDKDVSKGEPSYTIGGKVNWCNLENSMAVPEKLKIELPSDPAIPLLGMCI